MVYDIIINKYISIIIYIVYINSILYNREGYLSLSPFYHKLYLPSLTLIIMMSYSVEIACGGISYFRTNPYPSCAAACHTSYNISYIRSLVYIPHR